MNILNKRFWLTSGFLVPVQAEYRIDGVMFRCWHGRRHVSGRLPVLEVMRSLESQTERCHRGVMSSDQHLDVGTAVRWHLHGCRHFVVAIAISLHYFYQWHCNHTHTQSVYVLVLVLVFYFFFSKKGNSRAIA